LDILPSDHVYNWAAFNKLLLLGMYAPVEEAASPEGQSQLAAQQLQEVAAAREVRTCDCRHTAHMHDCIVSCMGVTFVHVVRGHSSTVLAAGAQYMLRWQSNLAEPLLRHSNAVLCTPDILA
jgi:hypothetical protein